jgi:hypothetical protein
MEPEGSLLCSQEPATGPYPSQMNPVHALSSHLRSVLSANNPSQMNPIQAVSFSSFQVFWTKRICQFLLRLQYSMNEPK